MSMDSIDANRLDTYTSESPEEDRIRSSDDTCMSQYIVGLMDFTLLDVNATHAELHDFCYKANVAKPAAICVFAKHVRMVKGLLGEGILVAAVCGGFPIGSSDSTEVVQSIQLAISSGADEIDCVLEPRQTSDFPGPSEETMLKAIRSACGSLTLKVILETPLLDEQAIRETSLMALSAGADFIKSCTGKRGGCSHDAARVMASELQAFETLCGNKRGIKISGGIQTKEQAMELLAVIQTEYPTLTGHDRNRIRIGASSLMKNLMPQLYGRAMPTAIPSNAY
jgi:deoxyribose-phosphate aldolase